MKFIFYILLVACISTSSLLRAQTPISAAIKAEYLKSGINAAIKRYEYLKKNETKNFDFSENQLRDLAFELYSEDKSADARKLLLLNSQNFPSSTHAFYFLGFLDYKLGNAKEALVSLKKSLSLDAGNSFSRDLIQAIEKPAEYATYKYVCPPCFCSQHDLKFKAPGKCIHCGMKLADKDAVDKEKK